MIKTRGLDGKFDEYCVYYISTTTLVLSQGLKLKKKHRLKQICACYTYFLIMTQTLKTQFKLIVRFSIRSYCLDILCKSCEKHFDTQIGALKKYVRLSKPLAIF